MDGGQVQGALHHTGRLRAGTEAAEVREEEEEIEHDLRQDSGLILRRGEERS